MRGSFALAFPLFLFLLLATFPLCAQEPPLDFAITVGAEWRPISVEVKGRDLEVFAPAGYYASW